MEFVNEYLEQLATYGVILHIVSGVITIGGIVLIKKIKNLFNQV